MNTDIMVPMIPAHSIKSMTVTEKYRTYCLRIEYYVCGRLYVQETSMDKSVAVEQCRLWDEYGPKKR